MPDTPSTTKDAGTPLAGPGGLIGEPGLGTTRRRKWGNRSKNKACTCGVNVATKEQLAPGITRIRGNLCNVHGRYGPCDAGLSKKKPKAGKGRKPAKPKKATLTPEQRAAARDQQHAENRAKVLSQLGLPEDAAGALESLRAGTAVDDDGGLVKLGLAEQAADGSYRLTASGRALANAASSGDAGRARDVMSSARDRLGARQERQSAASARHAAAEQRKQEVAARRAAALAKKKQPKKSGGSKGGTGSSASSSADREAERVAAREQRQREHAEDRARRLREHEEDRKRRQAERDADRAARQKPVPMNTGLSTPVAAPLPVPKRRKTPIEYGKRRRQTAGKSFTVFKDTSGAHRWIARSTTAYRDREGEIISERALERDAARMTATGQYGPLRYWHIGEPDPFDPVRPWGPGLDIGDCDYSIVIGRTSIESGTFKSAAIGQAFAESADDYEMSPGFFHPMEQPNAANVYDDIRRFERSPVPIAFSRASNLFTGMTVKEFHMDQATYDARVKAFTQDMNAKGVPPEVAASALAGMEQADKSAAAQGIAFKSETPADPWQAVVAALKAAVLPAEKAPMPPEEMIAAGETELDDGADDEGTEEGSYIGDMSIADFEQLLGRALQSAIQQFGGDITTRMAAMDEAVKGMGYARTKAESAATAEITALKARLAELEGNKPAVTLPSDIEAALKSTGPAASPDPNAPQVPNDPTRPFAAVAAQTFPQLYQPTPQGGWAGWAPPTPLPPNQS